MSSARKAAANRQYALKSTGPKTPDGKAAVRLNALRHGLLSQDILLPGEDEEALRELAEGLRAELQPVGELEGVLLDRITSLLWRLQRVGRVEAGIFAHEFFAELADRAEREARAQESTLSDLMAFADTSIGDEGKHREALQRAQEMRVKQDAENTALGRTFARDADSANAFSKLSRYETAIERGLYKALHELQRLQAVRAAAGSVPPPVAVDVDVSGIPEGDR
jgi:hypothetical protein